MDETSSELVKMAAGAVLRSAATVWGTDLAAHGLLSGDADQKTFVGAVMVLGALAWSVGQKYGSAIEKALIKKLTGQDTVKSAVAVAKMMPPVAPAIAALVGIGLAFSLLFAEPVRAADLPAKAPSMAVISGVGSACTPTSCNGLYAGFGLGGNGTNADIVGNGINGSVFAGGIIPSIDVGYIYKQGDWLLAVEANLGYQMESGVSVNGVSANVNGIVAYEVIKAGGNVSSLFGGSAPISIPPQLASSLISLYGQVGPAEVQIAGKFNASTASGAGAFFDVGPTSFIALDYLNIAKAGNMAGPINIVKASWNHKF